MSFLRMEISEESLAPRAAPSSMPAVSSPMRLSALSIAAVFSASLVLHQQAIFS